MTDPGCPLEAARSIGPPIYTARGLIPIRYSGSGRSGDVVTSLTVSCGTAAGYVKVGVRIDRPNLPSWPVTEVIAFGRSRSLPLEFDRTVVAMDVDGTPTEFPIVSCGRSWAGETRVADRWVALSSGDVAVSAVSLVSIDLDELQW